MRDLGKLIVAKGFKKLPKVQKIARSGHTGRGCGTVGRAINSDTKGPRFESSHEQFYLAHIGI